MKQTLLAILAFFAADLHAASCCLGGNPKSFISLNRLQKYEVGLSTSARDVYGRYDLYGDTETTDRNQTLNMSLGAGARLTEDLQTFAIVPFVYQQSRYSRTAIGDVLFGAQYILLESLFKDEWYPTITLSAGIKAPSGMIEKNVDGKLLPGTGNGIWEPFVGVALQKSFGDFTLTTRGSYTSRLTRNDFKEGDMFEFAESGAYAWNARLSTSLGLVTSWTLAQQRNGGAIADSHTRVLNGFASATYFVDRFWSVTGGIDATVPIARLGVNQSMSQSVSFTTRYGFY